LIQDRLDKLDKLDRQSQQQTIINKLITPNTKYQKNIFAN